MSRKKRLVFHVVSLSVIALLALVAFNQDRKKVQIELHDREIYVRESSGQLRQLTHDGKPKENAVLSPSGDRVIYHSPFNPYTLPPEPPIFTVLDVETGDMIRQIPVRWVARFVSSVEWINDQFVMVRGEGCFLVILNLKTGKQTHNLVGWVRGRGCSDFSFSLSPDKRKIVFHHDFTPRYGPIPPELESDYVLLSLVEREPPSGQVKYEYDFSNFKVVYPDVLPWGEIELKRYDDLDERHLSKSTFAWSADSRMVAFVEGHRGAFWVVVLEIEVKDSEVKVSPRRFELAKELGEVTGVEWTSEDQAIKVVTEKVTYVVDLGTGEVQVQRSQ